MKKKIKSEDEIRLEVWKDIRDMSDRTIKWYEQLIKNGRCKECKKLLTDKEKHGICDDCLCPV